MYHTSCSDIRGMNLQLENYWCMIYDELQPTVLKLACWPASQSSRLQNWPFGFKAVWGERSVSNRASLF